MASYVPPKINTAFVFYTSLEDQANAGLFKASATLAAGDVKVAIDDGAPANLATLPVVDADFTKRIKVSLSAGEMNGDNITVIFSDAAGAEWYDQAVSIQTSATQIDDVAAAAELAKVPKSDSTVSWNATALAAINAEADTALADYAPAKAGDAMDLVPAPNATAVLAIQSGLSTFDAVADTVAHVTLVDTTTTNTDMVAPGASAVDMAAVKAKTDNLPIDPASQATTNAAITAATAGLSTLDPSDVATVLQTLTLPDNYAALGAQPTFAEAILGTYQYLMERSVVGTTVSIKKPDGTTVIMTFALDDGNEPMSQTRAS